MKNDELGQVNPIIRSGNGCDSRRLNLYTIGYQGVDVDVYTEAEGYRCWDRSPGNPMES